MKELIITNKILNWYDIHKRTLPWRKKTSLKKKQYYTLVSEFMLQQTQVATVIPYFNRFIKHIPKLEALARYDDQKLIKLWEGLGYYSRVKNLKKTAQIVVKDFNKNLKNGKGFPQCHRICKKGAKFQKSTTYETGSPARVRET